MLPLQLSQEKDDAIFHLTEGRIPVFAHDLVPDYLRTKPEPTAEQRMLAHEQKVSVDFFLNSLYRSSVNSNGIV